MVHLPTGAGKTRLAAEIIRGALAKGKRVAFVVPALSLIDQTVAAFEAEGIRTRRSSWSAFITLGTVTHDSFRRRERAYPHPNNWAPRDYQMQRLALSGAGWKTRNLRLAPPRR